MAEPGGGEGPPQQQNPDQGPQNQKIAIAIRELNLASRTLTEPRLLSRSQTPQESPYRIQYANADHTKFVTLWQSDFYPEDYRRRHTLPLRLKQEGIIPIGVHHADKNDPDTVRDYTKLWVEVGTNNLTVLEALRDGKPLESGEDLNGSEEVVERPKFLPDILDAMSGETYTTTPGKVWKQNENRPDEGSHQ